MEEKWKKLSKKELASTSSSSNYSSSSSKSSSFFSRSSSSKSPLLRSLSQKHAPNSAIKSPSDLPRSSSLKNASSSSSIGHKCSSLAKEQKARFYIMRRCVAMLVCWHKHGDP